MKKFTVSSRVREMGRSVQVQTQGWLATDGGGGRQADPVSPPWLSWLKGTSGRGAHFCQLQRNASPGTNRREQNERHCPRSLGIRELLHSNSLSFRSSHRIGNEEDSFWKHIIRGQFPKGPTSHVSSAKQPMTITTQRRKGEQSKSIVSQKCIQ